MSEQIGPELWTLAVIFAGMAVAVFGPVAVWSWLVRRRDRRRIR